MTIVVAAGPAFTFAYAEHAELLAAAGARVVTVDPLVDAELPPDTAGLVLPGGFPEEHVATLSGNTRLMRQVAARAADGMPVHAECAGMLYLGRVLAGRDGDEYPMAGALPLRGAWGPRLTLGYREAVATADSVLFRAGKRVTGHEFHRTVVEPEEPVEPEGPVEPAEREDDAGGVAAAWAWRDRVGARVDEGVVAGNVHASYLHVHPAGCPEAVVRFVDAARAWRRSRSAQVDSGNVPDAG